MITTYLRYFDLLDCFFILIFLILTMVFIAATTLVIIILFFTLSLFCHFFKILFLCAFTLSLCHLIVFLGLLGGVFRLIGVNNASEPCVYLLVIILLHLEHFIRAKFLKRSWNVYLSEDCIVTFDLSKLFRGV